MDPDSRGSPARPDGPGADSDGAGGRVLAWAPGLTGASDRKAAEPAKPEPPEPDGFGELDLIVTPVSVTPPRTWRRAAWFAVGASCVVLTVLVFAAARLAGPGGTDRLDAFPGLPTGGLLTPQPLGPPVQPRPDTSTSQPEPRVGAGGQPASTGSNGTQGGAEHPSGGDQGQPRGGPAAPRTTAPGSGGSDIGTAAAPTVSMLPSTGRPAVTAEDMVSTTRTFFATLPGDIDAAWEMVGPRVKVRGYDSFRAQWANVDDLQLQSVVVDADGSTVIATVQIVRKGGSTTVERFELTFRQSSSVQIDDFRPLDRGTN
jgi:hypothetical protein